ncbi:hypothetical protein HMN09_00709700 [Mycena chlorophos]|uniref:Store-operated calcium entry-associated regulatory factor n=1 Tax=Mycena chlorophos TaxID=658473 RepID=A0A8H6WDN9_MYCCL|nr:hypothetical protein HMN09_00709700 [Mycena chlorophos]
MSRVELASIRALTFYKDSLTEARRTSPIEQLTCVGKPCKLFQPDVVRCESLGGSKTDVDWKCTADLPDALRFGRVEVSCEGWSAPGDPYVLKGSCGLQYHLVQVPSKLRDSDSDNMLGHNRNSNRSDKILRHLFMVVFVAVLGYIVYSFVKSWASAQTRPGRSPRAGGGGHGWTPGPGGGGGGFPGGFDGDDDPPPPYTKPSNQNTHPQAPAAAQNQAQGWQNFRPGFWTGAALGGLATNTYNQRQQRQRERQLAEALERDRMNRGQPAFGGQRSPPRQQSSSRYSFSPDTGEGSSNLGRMRQSTGFGGSSVR